jgi:hypothetical protein
MQYDCDWTINRAPVYSGRQSFCRQLRASLTTLAKTYFRSMYYSPLSRSFCHSVVCSRLHCSKLFWRVTVCNAYWRLLYLMTSKSFLDCFILILACWGFQRHLEIRTASIKRPVHLHCKDKLLDEGNWIPDPCYLKERPPIILGCCGNQLLTSEAGPNVVNWSNPQMGVADTILTRTQGVVDLIWLKYHHQGFIV